ncbi:MAG: lipopolysaccharide biosynthesis protein [Labilithrix sp.]|nr:lipopolysaccharide biosynthesis protein [Labilithrix sp.]
MTEEEAPDQARRAGRGGLAVLFAKVFFIGTGLVQQALLPRAIGLADYGALSRVLAVSNVFNNVVISSSTQGVSRTVAGAGQNEREALRATLGVHGVLALGAAALLAIAAPLVAFFQHAPDVLAPLLVMTGVLGIYGVYAPLVGYLNGRGLFTRQATLDIVAATLRTGGLLGVGYVFARHAGALAASLGTSPGVLGATVGAVLASIGVFSLALRWTGTGRKLSGERPAGVPVAKAYIALIVPVMVAQLFTNGLMQADIFLLGRYLSLSAATSGVADPTKTANEWVAVYRACQLFAFLPYQLLFSVTQILFPMLARARAEEGDARVADLVRRGCRIGAIVCGLLLTIVLAMPGSLIKFAYGAEVAARGAASLRVLALGQACFAVLGLSTTILVSLGRERTAMAITAVALALLAASCSVVIPSAEFGEAQLRATAAATTGALALALVVGVVTVRSAAGAFVPWKTAVRVGGCAAGAFALGGVMPVFSKLLTPVVAAGVMIAYLVALVVTGELGKEDLSLVLSIAVRRAKR